MSDKYIDLAELITDEIGGYQTEHSVTLNWLDRLAVEHPDQVPGRTITESDYRDLELDLSDGNQSFGAVVECLGITIVPDPAPTIPLPTEPGAHFIAYSPKWCDGPEDQREFVVAGTSIVDIDTGNTFHRTAFADYWTVTALVKAPGADDDH